MTERILKPNEKIDVAEEVNNKKSETSEERAKQRRFEVIRRNHNIALKALQIENLLSKSEELGLHPLLNPQIKKELNSLPEKFKKGFRKAISNYLKIRFKVKQIEKIMEKRIELDKEYSGVMTPEKWGEFIFFSLTKKQPEGKVKFWRRETYFIMTFSNLKDYTTVVCLSKKEDQVTEESLRRADKTSGCYTPEIRLPFSKIYIPVILIRSEEGRDLELIRRTELHERQHFINEKVFNLFYSFETHPSFVKSLSNQEIRRNFCMIKDEVLAYIRDGKLGEYLKSSIFGELYIHLFSFLPPQEAQKAKEIIDIVANFLDKNHSFLNNPESRTILVYQLVSVPFEEFPKWLSVLEEYYRERLRVFDRFFRVRLFSGSFSLQDFSELIKRSFPSAIEEELKNRKAYTEGQKILEELFLIEKEAQNILYNQSVSFNKAFSHCGDLGKRYAQLCAKLEDLYSPIFQKAVCAPNAGHMKTYSFDEEDYYTEKPSQLTPSIINIRQAILDTVFNFPQESINLIADYLSGKTKTKPKELDTLANLVKNTVHGFNGGKDCRLDFSIEEKEQPSFLMEVHYLAPQEDNELDIKEVKIPISFYSK